MSNARSSDRRRLWLGALLLGLIGCLAAGGFCAAGFMADQRNVRREVAAQNLQQLLSQARSLAALYTRERLETRQALQQRLSREAADICGNIQIFLQTALVRQEARHNARRNAVLQDGGQELQKMLRQQTENGAKMAAALTSASAAITSITPLAADGSPASSASVSEGSGAIAASPVPISDEEKIRLLHEFSQLQEKTIRTIARLEATAAAAGEVDQTASLLRESGADIEGFLPGYGSFTVAEAGGRVLLALGSGSTAASKSAIRAEATRNLLLSTGDENKHWVLRVVLNDLAAPALPGGAELAQYLGERLGLQQSAGVSASDLAAGRAALAGCVYNSDGTISGYFPRGAGEELSGVQPAAGWQADRLRQRFFERVEAQAPAEWGLGLLATLPTLPVEAQLAALARENPAAVIGFVVAALLLLIGIGINARLAWRGVVGSGTLLDAATLCALTQNAGVAQPRPVLGSLERLQFANRGRQGEGSRILDLAKSPVLRDLAARIRCAPRAAEKESRPGLREYGKSRSS